MCFFTKLYNHNPFFQFQSRCIRCKLWSHTFLWSNTSVLLRHLWISMTPAGGGSHHLWQINSRSYHKSSSFCCNLNIKCMHLKQQKNDSEKIPTVKEKYTKDIPIDYFTSNLLKLEKMIWFYELRGYYSFDIHVCPIIFSEQMIFILRISTLYREMSFQKKS
jgi:hypothetical protein